MITMKWSNKFILLMGCTATILLFSFSSYAIDVKSLDELTKDDARIAKSIPVDNNIDANTAYLMATTKNIPIVDIRTIQEYQFVGHIPFAYNLPVQVWGNKWDAKKNNFSLDPNPDFVKEFEHKFPDKSASYIITCRSGHRSPKAVDLLVKAGYTNLYNMWEGFEGVAVKEKELPTFNQKVVDEWKNKGLPYTWNIDQKLICTRS